jgi:hypothetical protein
MGVLDYCKLEHALNFNIYLCILVFSIIYPLSAYSVIYQSDTRKTIMAKIKTDENLFPCYRESLNILFTVMKPLQDEAKEKDPSFQSTKNKIRVSEEEYEKRKSSGELITKKSFKQLEDKISDLRDDLRRWELDEKVGKGKFSDENIFIHTTTYNLTVFSPIGSITVSDIPTYKASNLLRDILVNEDIDAQKIDNDSILFFDSTPYIDPNDDKPYTDPIERDQESRPLYYKTEVKNDEEIYNLTRVGKNEFSEIECNKDKKIILYSHPPLYDHYCNNHYYHKDHIREAITHIGGSKESFDKAR